MSILLSSPGVTDIPDNEERTALMWAAQRGNYKVLEVMLQKEVNVHAFDNLGGTGGQGHMQAYLSLLYSLKISREKIFAGQRMATKFFSRKTSSS